VIEPFWVVGAEYQSFVIYAVESTPLPINLYETSPPWQKYRSLIINPSLTLNSAVETEIFA
jgi:hypothetical protein